MSGKILFRGSVIHEIFKISRLMSVILSLSLLSVSPSRMRQLEGSDQGLRKKKYAAAMKLFRPLAEKGKRSPSTRSR